MTEQPGDRLRKARENRGFRTAKAAADAFGWNPVTYTSHENGSRGLTRDTARKYAHAFGTTIDYLLGIKSPNKDFTDTAKRVLAFKTLPRLDWQIMAMGENLDQRIENAENFRSIPSEQEVSKRAFALDNIDDSMLDKDGSAGKSFSEGDLLVVDPEAETNPGDFVIAQVSDCDRWVFREYRISAYENGKPIIRLTPLNKAYPTYEISPDQPGQIIGRLMGRYDRF